MTQQTVSYPSTSVDGAVLQTRLHLAFAATLLVWLVVQAPTYISLVSTWARTGTFQFAFLIFPICAFLAWGRRSWLTRVSGEPCLPALWLAAALALLWLLGAILGINLAQHVAAVAILPVWVTVFYGPPVVRVLAFPLGYLLFAIPFGNFMVGPLQTVTAHLAVAALSLTDVPVLMDGHFIDTPASAWHVAAACSGVKFFVATIAFGVLYVHLFFTSWRRRLIFLACCAVVPVVANGLRVFFTILIGEHYGLQYATGTDHLVFGWQFFGTVLVLLFFAGWPFHQPPHGPPAPALASTPVPSARIVRVTVLSLLVILIPAALAVIAYLLTPHLGLQASAALGRGTGA